jgi:hypothetical protein
LELTSRGQGPLLVAINPGDLEKACRMSWGKSKLFIQNGGVLFKKKLKRNTTFADFRAPSYSEYEPCLHAWNLNTKKVIIL